MKRKVNKVNPGVSCEAETRSVRLKAIAIRLKAIASIWKQRKKEKNGRQRSSRRSQEQRARLLELLRADLQKDEARETRETTETE